MGNEAAAFAIEEPNTDCSDEILITRPSADAGKMMEVPATATNMTRHGSSNMR